MPPVITDPSYHTRPQPNISPPTPHRTSSTSGHRTRSPAEAGSIRSHLRLSARAHSRYLPACGTPGWRSSMSCLTPPKTYYGNASRAPLKHRPGAWIISPSTGAEARKGILIHNSSTMRRRINFATALAESIMAHAITPLLSSFPAVANVFVALDNGKMVSATQALLVALYAPYQGDIPDASVYRDLAYVARKLTQEPSVEDNNAYLKATLGLLISAVEQGRAPSAVLESLAESAYRTITGDAELAELLTNLDVLLSSHGQSNK
jgi:hypothetical protein